MASSSAGFHEAEQSLTPRTRDLHRAIVSIMEELEAIDWYQQRADATGDAELRQILEHNRDEEKEHAVMVLEWLRRQDAGFDRSLRRYLFTDRPILAIEEATDGAEAPVPPPAAGIGSLRKRG